MPRIFVFAAPFALWLYLMRDFISCKIPVNMDTDTIYGVVKFYFDNLLNGVVPLWEAFVSLGRPFYAISICNLFNPVTQLVPLLKILGMDYAHAFVLYMAAYFLTGCAGFYLLSLQIFKDRHVAFLGFLAFMFSSLGASMFTQFTFLEMTVPAIWFFFFLLRFAGGQTRGNFLGLTTTAMVLISAYLPFYFVTVFLCFLAAFIPLYAKEAKAVIIHAGLFKLKHWRLSLLCLAGILLAAAPLLAYKVLDAGGEVVAPGRHCEYTSAQECYDRTMAAQGGMAYDEITRSGSLGERLDMQYLFGDLDKTSYGSDSFLFLPVWIYVVLGLSLFLPLTRLTVVLSATGLLTGLVALGSASGLHAFLFHHIFFFTYFRNLFFLGAFLIPIVILLAMAQLQVLLNLKLKSFSARKMLITGIIILHTVFFWFLKRYAGVPPATYVTLGCSLAAWVFYYSGLLRFSRSVWTTVFAFILLLQPVWLLRAYAFNATEFAFSLPSDHVKPVFAWKRPLAPQVVKSRIYQFVPYEDFWYDMSMTDAPPRVGYPQSATRWTFDLSEHTPPAVLANYAQYKIVLYDDGNPVGQPVSAPSPALSVNHFDVNTLKLHSDFATPKTLVYNDSYTSSWKAAIDGSPVELLRANQAFKGIRVPAGEHELEFSYHPPGGSWVYIAATGSLFIFLLTTVFMLLWRL